MLSVGWLVGPRACRQRGAEECSVAAEWLAQRLQAERGSRVQWPGQYGWAGTDAGRAVEWLEWSDWVVSGKVVRLACSQVLALARC